MILCVPLGKISKLNLNGARKINNKLRWTLASHHSSKNFGRFWRETSKMNPRSGLPGSVDGCIEPEAIANIFKNCFIVESPLGRAEAKRASEDGCPCVGAPVSVSAKDVAVIIKRMTRGKSPGQDGLSIEHLKYAGVHLPRILAMFFTFCIRHSYLPTDLMRTVVVPVIKNRTGDASDKTNYRPISLANTIAKVLDSVLDYHLGASMKLNDAQFGFRPGLSTESAILCLKHTVRYYTDRKTPVYACFLDLTKAFDLVSYDVLWSKLSQETDLPAEMTNILRYWYEHQTNAVR